MLEKANIDRRKRRTRQLIKNALISLMAQKDFQSITVQDITNLADVNRATFYSHYHDKHDLLQKVIDETLNELEEIIHSYIFKKYLADHPEHSEPYDLFFCIFKQVYENGDFYKVMLSRNRVPGVWEKLFVIINDAAHTKFTQLEPDARKPDVPQDIMNSYLSSAYIGVIIHWINKGMPYTPEYMAEQLTYIRFN